MFNRFKDFEHLIRLAFLFIAAVIVFVVVRSFLVPKSFGKFGHYRADALADVKANPIHFAGQKSCIPCHQTVAEEKLISHHRLLSCESCHGPLSDHAQNPTVVKAIIPESIELCGRCHSRNISRPKDLPQIDIESHRQGLTCIECHYPHHPELRSSSELLPTSYAGQGNCGDCHKQIIEQKLTSKHRFLSCVGCHGHIYQHMQNPLKTRPKKPSYKQICWRCHSDRNKVERPVGFPVVNLENHSQGKSCLLCHSPHHPEVQKAVAVKLVQYAGAGTCVKCHEKIEQQKNTSLHRLLSCELCHGPAKAHTENPSEVKLTKIVSRELCSQCHDKEKWRSNAFPQIDVKQHNPGYGCEECHSPHYPNLEK